MLALRNSKVDHSKWEPVSFGHTPPSKVKTLAAQGFVILEITANTIARARRWYGQGVQKAFYGPGRSPTKATGRSKRMQ